jgi:hypothetical protein
MYGDSVFLRRYGIYLLIKVHGVRTQTTAMCYHISAKLYFVTFSLFRLGHYAILSAFVFQVRGS